MNLYLFRLPYLSNNRVINYDSALIEWRKIALNKSGGCTDTGKVFGQALGADGVVHTDMMHNMEVACSPDVKDELVMEAFRLYPDQAVIFVAQIGTAEIIENVAMSLAA